MKPLEEMTGLELREAVAVEVMGLAVGRVEYAPELGEDSDYVPYRNTVTGQELRGLMYSPGMLVVGNGAVPAYESSIEAAFAVVEKMREKGCREFTAGTHGADWGATFKGHVGKRWRVFNGYSDTLPLAICRAALQAVRAK